MILTIAELAENFAGERTATERSEDFQYCI